MFWYTPLVLCSKCCIIFDTPSLDLEGVTLLIHIHTWYLENVRASKFYLYIFQICLHAHFLSSLCLQTKLPQNSFIAPPLPTMYHYGYICFPGKSKLNDIFGQTGFRQNVPKWSWRSGYACNLWCVSQYCQSWGAFCWWKTKDSTGTFELLYF